MSVTCFWEKEDRKDEDRNLYEKQDFRLILLNYTTEKTLIANIDHQKLPLTELLLSTSLFSLKLMNKWNDSTNL